MVVGVWFDVFVSCYAIRLCGILRYLDVHFDVFNGFVMCFVGISFSNIVFSRCKAPISVVWMCVLLGQTKRFFLSHLVLFLFCMYS